MEKLSMKATVMKIKLIKVDDPMLAHIQLSKQNEEKVNAIIGKNVLTFMLDVQVGDQISVFGHYNQRKQFVIERYLNPNKINNYGPKLPGHLQYPHRKEE